MLAALGAEGCEAAVRGPGASGARGSLRVGLHLFICLCPRCHHHRVQGLKIRLLVPEAQGGLLPLPLRVPLSEGAQLCLGYCFKSH